MFKVRDRICTHIHVCVCVRACMRVCTCWCMCVIYVQGVLEDWKRVLKPGGKLIYTDAMVRADDR